MARATAAPPRIKSVRRSILTKTPSFDQVAELRVRVDSMPGKGKPGLRIDRVGCRSDACPGLIHEGACDTSRAGGLAPPTSRGYSCGSAPDFDWLRIYPEGHPCRLYSCACHAK